MDVSVVVPFFNPGSRLGVHLANVIDVLEISCNSYEVLAVSDGSTDSSERSIAHLISRDQHSSVTLVTQPHQGKGAAVRAGLARATGRWRGFIDGDGDIPAQCLAPALAATTNPQAEIVIASKAHPGSSVSCTPLRRLYSAGYRQMVSLLFDLTVTDTQVGLKLFRADLLEEVLPHCQEQRFALDVEMLALAHRLGRVSIYEVPVEIKDRLTSAVSLRTVGKTLVDTLQVRRRIGPPSRRRQL